MSAPPTGAVKSSGGPLTVACSPSNTWFKHSQRAFDHRRVTRAPCTGGVATHRDCHRSERSGLRCRVTSVGRANGPCLGLRVNIALVIVYNITLPINGPLGTHPLVRPHGGLVSPLKPKAAQVTAAARSAAWYGRGPDPLPHG